MKTKGQSNTKTRRHGELRRRTEDTKIPPPRTFVSLQHGLLLSAFVSLCLLNTSLAFLTKSSSWGLTISLEETKDHRRGCTPPAPERSEEPPVRNMSGKEAPKGRQNVQLVCVQHIKTLSPCRGFFCCRTTTGGLRPRLWSFVSSRLMVSPNELLFVRKADG